MYSSLSRCRAMLLDMEEGAGLTAGCQGSRPSQGTGLQACPRAFFWPNRAMHLCGLTVSCRNSQLGVEISSQAMAHGRRCAIARERQRDAAGVVRAGLAVWVVEAEHRLWRAERGESVHFYHIGCLVMLQIIVPLRRRCYVLRRVSVCAFLPRRATHRFQSYCKQSSP